MPGAHYGEELIAFVAPVDGARIEADAVRAYCRAHLPPIKVPKTVVVVDALPRNARNKLDRKALIGVWQERSQAEKVR